MEGNYTILFTFYRQNMAAVGSFFLRRTLVAATLAEAVENDGNEDGNPQPPPPPHVQAPQQPRARRRIRPRVYKLRINLFNIPDDEVLRIYRFNIASILHIFDLIKDDISGERVVATGVSPLVRLLAVLQFLATGSYQRVCAMANGFTQSTFSKVFNAVLAALLRRTSTFITFPKTLQELQEAKSAFYSIDGFPNVVGCIDGTHIRVVPPSFDEEIYRNRKRTHSINVQMVCDANLKFIHCFANFPGSAHDSYVLRNSSIPLAMERLPHESGWLLGDSGYGLKPWLLTPILRPQTPGEVRYNEAHISTRNTIERAFGVLKSRFRCLDITGGDLLYSPEKVCKIVVVCCILHNIARSRNIPLPLDETPIEPPDVAPPETGNLDYEGGRAVRNYVVQHFFT